MARLWVLVDNEALEGFRPAWGLSILAETQEGSLVLFDTGPDPEVLCSNAEAMGAEGLLGEVEAVVISHPHRDHYGGLPCVARHAAGVQVVLPPSPPGLVAWVRRLGLAPSPVAAPLEAAPGAHATRALEAGIGLMERALAITTSTGAPAALLGCSHPGGDRLVETALEELGAAERALLAIGGLHSPPRRVVDRLAELAEKIAPIHCSGPAKDYVKTRYPEKYVEAKAGTVLAL